MKPILEVQDLTYAYPGTSHLALQGMTLRIPAGKKTAICGQNGSGKSTFFLHAIGIHRPKSGALHWKGAPYSYQHKELAKLRQNIGLVFQDPEQQLILHTPYEDVSYGLRNAKLPEPEIRSRTESILEQMGLAHLAHTPLHHLSLGQKKRVSLAGVLALQPELLLLDEPTAFLDRRSEHQLVDELERIHQQGITLVMATHDLNLAYAWADWILVFDRGTCVMEGTPEEVFHEVEKIEALGLEMPMLLDIWQALPAAWRAGQRPPRDVASFKAWIKSHS
ncbi:energy-coupling factor ABC transporter ATP-binding protein [Tumebacillus lipolyticus]|uniref:Energy-coupling factor ABC transporter ATP-binding protein n=1 Tax=Tumebacillus lipolyticus TaxID=1280370 RepID=A0ABW4ZXN4_9BACL